jgi:hypothetical protein
VRRRLGGFGWRQHPAQAPACHVTGGVSESVCGVYWVILFIIALYVFFSRFSTLVQIDSSACELFTMHFMYCSR